MEKVTIKIGGMTCMGCVGSVKRVLEGLAGVDTVDVSLEKAQAIVGFDPSKATSALLASAIEDAGYDVVA
jgi:copper chaperone